MLAVIPASNQLICSSADMEQSKKCKWVVLWDSIVVCYQVSLRTGTKYQLLFLKFNIINVSLKNDKICHNVIFGKKLW